MKTSAAAVGMLLVCMGTGCATTLEDQPVHVAGPVPAKESADGCVLLSRHGGDAVEDSRIAEAWPDKQYGRQPVAFTGMVGQGQREFLVRFGLDDVPEGADVREANLIVYRSVCNDSKLSVHQITSPWHEDHVSWTSLDRRFDARPFAQVDRSCKSGPSRVRIDVTPVVRGWLDGQRENHGLMVRTEKAASFATSESARPEEQPALQLCFASSEPQRLAAGAYLSGDSERDDRQ